LALLYDAADPDRLFTSPWVIVLQTLGVTAPVVAAVLVTRKSGGSGAVRVLLSGFRRWRVRPSWYAVACLLVPTVTLLGLLARAAVGIHPAVPEGSALAEELAEIGWVGAVLTFPLQLFGQSFGSPLLEEPGWRGFAFPLLRRRIGAAGAAFGVGAIWGIWHLPLFLAFGDNLPISLPLITMHGFLLAWIYTNTGGSLLLVVLGHASMSVANNVLSLPEQGVAQVLLTFALCVLIISAFRATDLRPRKAARQ
jgi:CDP-diacylglycerol--glycerol-3-phosphate 3-phosphatidyltransferase